MTGGPHHHDGCDEWINNICYDDKRPWSSLDFQDSNGNGIVRAAGDGVVWRSSLKPEFVRIDHACGWRTGYHHLKNQNVDNGQFLFRGKVLGETSIAGGPKGHVHFSLRRGDEFQELNNHNIGGWIVIDGSQQYNGCLRRISDGYQVCQWGKVDNDGTIGSGEEPSVISLSVIPRNILLGESISITYTLLDYGISELKHIELWRAIDRDNDDEPDWPDNPDGYIDIHYLSVESPYRDTFIDSPDSSGTYWYGVHVVDHAGYWSVEPYPPGPLKVEVFDDLPVCTLETGGEPQSSHSIVCVTPTPSSPQFPSLPTIETRPATDIWKTGTILNGRIFDDGGSPIVERRFDWGTTPNCSDGWTANVSVSGDYFSYYLSGLEPGTTYYFRTWATNKDPPRGSDDWGQGEVLSFTTLQQSIGPLEYYSHSIDDDTIGSSNGDGDGVAECGESIELNITLKNQGGATATGVSASLSESDSYITISDSSEDFPDIPGGGTGEDENDYDFDVASHTPNGRVITFDLDITASNGGLWSDTFDVQVTCNTNHDPNPPDNPSPTDRKNGVPTNTDLSWAGGDPDPDDTVTYDVYFEANDSTPDQLLCNDTPSTTCNPNTLPYNTHYSWYVVATDNHGDSTTGTIWNFTTKGANQPPDPPQDPIPSNGQSDTFINADLGWIGGDPDPNDTVTYDVYFEGNDSTPEVLLCDDVSIPTCHLGTLTYNTHYYWYVVVTDDYGASTIGPIWDFTTKAQPDPTWHVPSATGKVEDEWSNPENAYLSDNVYTTTEGAYLDQDYYNFDFDIPSNATINGIEVEIEGHGEGYTDGRILVEIWSASSFPAGWGVKTNGQGGWWVQGYGSDAIAAGGGPEDLWGVSWLPSDFSNDNFLLKITTFSNSNKVYVDHIQAKVYYAIETPTCHTLTLQVDPSAGGNVSANPAPNCSGSTYAQGTDVTLTANPTSNYSRFTNWSGGASGSTNPMQITMDSDKSITANFEQSTFADVPFDHELWAYIEALWDGGYTAGCSTGPLMYCPDTVLNRAMSAVFMLRGHLGVGYTPPPEPWETFFDDWSLSDITWAKKWAAGMWQEGLTAGCQTDPLMYCPRRELPRVEASVFGLRMMHGVDYRPPDATGTLFADMTDVDYWGTKWSEQAYRDGLLPECGWQDGKPRYCSDDLINRSWAAYMIVKANNLPLPP